MLADPLREEQFDSRWEGRSSPRSPSARAIAYWNWAFDRGGPVSRLGPDPPPPDFQFLQTDAGHRGGRRWQPRLFDYLYVTFTNSIAFSPTDAMPLTRRAKAAMVLEAARPPR